MNRIILVTVSIILTCHLGDSAVWPLRADVWPSSSTHQVVRRSALPYWLKTLRDGGRLNSDGRLRKNREAEDIFSGIDSAIVSERYIQPSAQNGKVIASNSNKGNNNNNNNNMDNIEDAMIFAETNSNADKVIGVNRADYPLDSAAPSAIDFGVQDRMKNRSPHPHQHGRSPAGGCTKKNGPAAVASAAAYPVDSQANKSEAADVSLPVDFIDQPVDWTPLVNESQCQSYGPSQFCENVTNYPAEAIRAILMSDNGSLLTTFFADNTQPLPSASESDESMVLAQRKPGAPVTGHAINTRIKPSSEDVQSLCEYKTEYWFPKSGVNKDNENLFIVNQDNISQPIAVELCRSDAKGVNLPCKFAKNFPAGTEPSCIQKYAMHPMAAMKNGKIVRETFKFPSCCVCVVKQSFWDTRSMPVSVARRAIAMPSSLRRMAAEIDGQPSQ